MKYLSSPGRKILERPPYFVVLGRLLEFLTDFHGRIVVSRSYKKERRSEVSRGYGPGEKTEVKIEPSDSKFNPRFLQTLSESRIFPICDLCNLRMHNAEIEYQDANRAWTQDDMIAVCHIRL